MIAGKMLNDLEGKSYTITAIADNLYNTWTSFVTS
jgi:hypothetical protein